MKKLAIIILALALVGGCCENPGVFSQISNSMNTINTVAQPFYAPTAEGNTEAQMAIAAALAAAPLADALQKQWCPSQASADALAQVADSMKVTRASLKKKGIIK